MPTRSTRIVLQNKMDNNRALELAEKSLDHGRWSFEPNDFLGDEDFWESESHGIATGTEGRVVYIIRRGLSLPDGGQPQLRLEIHWNNPFIGTPSYSASVTPQGQPDGSGFSIGFFGAKRFDDNAEVTFVLLSGMATVDEETGAIIRTVNEPPLVIEKAPRQEGWRFCEKCGVMFFNGFDHEGGKGVCPAGGQHHAPANSFKYLVEHEHELISAQRDWRFCTKCGVLFFDGFPGKGVCRAGGSHEAAGFRYIVDHDIPASAKAQTEWRFCTKCGVIFFNDFENKGVCSADNQGHEGAGSLVYVLSHDIPPTNLFQAGWRFCKNCFALFFAGLAGQGRCPASDGHEHVAAINSFDYVIGHEPELPGEQHDWRFCTKCGVLFFDGFPGKGVCAAGNGHQAAGFSYFLPHGQTQTPSLQSHWHFCEKCGVLFFDELSLPEGRGVCASGGRHRIANASFTYGVHHNG